MARVPYSEGVPDVAATVQAPQDTQRIDANPSQFGGLIGQGEQRAGAGLEQGASAGFSAAQFFGQVAADDAFNNVQEGGNKIMYGDPTKSAVGPDGQPMMGPDGKPMPDVGFLGLSKRAALDARPNVQKQLTDLVAATREGLKTPEQRLRFDEYSRRYLGIANERIGAYTDQQASGWYTEVNSSSAKMALDGISNAPLDPVSMAHNASDLITAYTKNAELAGAQKGDVVWNQAYNAAKRDALRAQLRAVSVTDPARAMDMLDKNKTIAGIDYEPLAQEFRNRADQQVGLTRAAEAVKGTYTTMPAAAQIRPVLDEIGGRYGVSGDYLLRTHQLEGNGTSPTGAKGPFQFVGSTAKQYGVTDPFNLAQAADGAARLAADNKTSLTQSLGRAPTDAELYLAHQQGAGGASFLLRQPNLPAAEALAPAYGGNIAKAVEAIKVNGGDPWAPASAFTQMWTEKFNGAPTVANHSRKAAAYQELAGDPSLTPPQRQYALNEVNRTFAAQQVAEEADSQARKTASDGAANEWVTKLGTKQPVDINAMWNDPRLSYTAKMSIWQFATAKLGDDDAQFGPGYTQTYSRMFLPASDPSRITSMDAILQMGLPGGGLTTKGVQQLGRIWSEKTSARAQGIDPTAINQTKASLLKYAQSVMAREQMIPGMGTITVNKKGMEVFDSSFVPRFEAAYDDWMKGQKNPWEFLKKKNIDDMMDQIYPKSQRDADTMSALGQTPLGSEALPAAPDGVDPHVWTTVLGKTPTMPTGKMATPQQFGQALDILRKNPTPEMQAKFDKWFGAPGAKAEDLLGMLAGKKPAAAAAPASAVAPAPAAAEGHSLAQFEPAGHGSSLADIGRAVIPQGVQDYLKHAAGQ